jgi:hypothetical protein
MLKNQNLVCMVISMRSVCFLLILGFICCGHGRAEQWLQPISIPTHIQVRNDGDTLTFSGDKIHFEKIEGERILPYVNQRLLLPPDTDITSVRIEIQRECWQFLDIQGIMVQSAEQTGLPEFITDQLVRADKEFRSRPGQRVWPSDPIGEINLGHLRRWVVLDIRYFPYRYNLESEQLEMLSDGEWRVTFQTGGRRNPFRNDLSAWGMKRLRDWGLEPGQYFRSEQSPFLLRKQLDMNRPTYVILIPESLRLMCSSLPAFIRSKEERGFSIRVVTESDWGGGCGDVAAERIRTWLKTHSAPLQIEYALLIGNPDTESSHVPMKRLYPVPYSHSGERYFIPSDDYYAELTGEWDGDHDGYAGELPDDFVPGGVDRLYDIAVGRIPYYGDPSRVDLILDRCVTYENASRDQLPLRKNCLLAMHPLDDSTPSIDLGESIRHEILEPTGFWDYDRIYTTQANLNPPPEYSYCSKNHTRDLLNASSYGMFVWQTHGTPTKAEYIIDQAATTGISEQNRLHTFQSSCENSHPETVSNLSTQILQHCAVTSIGATRALTYYPGIFRNGTGEPAAIAYDYVQNMITGEMSASVALQEAKMACPRSMWWNVLSFTLYGDPSLGLYTHGEDQKPLLFLYSFPEPGWYLLSLPGRPEICRISWLFPNLDISNAHVYRQGRYITSETVTPGEGFWLYVKKPDCSLITVYPVESYSYTTEQAGWQLVGGFDETVSISPQIAWEYQRDQDSYVKTGQLCAGKGYWIYREHSGTFTVRSSAGMGRDWSQCSLLPSGDPPSIPQSVSPAMSHAVLHPAFPNPFNSSVSLSCTVSQKGNLYIKIYNSRGQLVRSLSRNQIAPGRHILKWDGRDETGRAVTSGIYLVRFQIGTSDKTQKVMCMR